MTEPNPEQRQHKHRRGDQYRAVFGDFFGNPTDGYTHEYWWLGPLRSTWVEAKRDGFKEQDDEVEHATWNERVGTIVDARHPLYFVEGDGLSGWFGASVLRHAAAQPAPAEEPVDEPERPQPEWIELTQDVTLPDVVIGKAGDVVQVLKWSVASKNSDPFEIPWVRPAAGSGARYLNPDEWVPASPPSPHRCPSCGDAADVYPNLCSDGFHASAPVAAPVDDGRPFDCRVCGHRWPCSEAANVNWVGLIAEQEAARAAAPAPSPEPERPTSEPPVTADFLADACEEAQFQIDHWGEAHDADKDDSFWFWTLGHIVGKAIHDPDQTVEKLRHRLRAGAALLLNWDRHVASRNGIEVGPLLAMEHGGAEAYPTTAAAAGAPSPDPQRQYPTGTGGTVLVRLDFEDARRWVNNAYEPHRDRANRLREACRDALGLTAGEVPE